MLYLMHILPIEVAPRILNGIKLHQVLRLPSFYFFINSNMKKSSLLTQSQKGKEVERNYTNKNGISL